MSVVLPAPFGPIRPTMPCGRSQVTSSSARGFLGKSLVRWLMEMNMTSSFRVVFFRWGSAGAVQRVVRGRAEHHPPNAMSRTAMTSCAIRDMAALAGVPVTARMPPVAG